MTTPTKEQIVEVMKNVKDKIGTCAVTIGEIVLLSINQWEKIRNSPK